VILVRSFPRGPCMNILQMPCLPGASTKAFVGSSWEVLVSRSCELSSRSSRSLWRSCELLFGGLAWRASSICQGLLQVLASSSCGDPCDMPSAAFPWPCAGPCAEHLKRLVKSLWCPCKVWYRSLCEDLVEISLQPSSKRSFYVWKTFWKFLYEDFVSSLK
jgi:hypothetical protein